MENSKSWQFPKNEHTLHNFQATSSHKDFIDLIVLIYYKYYNVYGI